MSIKAFAAHEARGKLEPFEYDPGELKHDEVEIRVRYCGVCHSDLAMLDNEWGFSGFPLVPGHEVVGTVEAVGKDVTRVQVGDNVGLGWFSRSCQVCSPCMSGDHNLCASTEATILGRFGGFADRVRCHALWAIPLPNGIDLSKAGPLFCGGATVFNPLVEMGVRPTDRVGVIGIGGLGHLALQFLRAWGCHVTAFTSSEAKMDEAKKMGAHTCVNSRDASALESQAGSFDFILSTVAVDLEWGHYLAALGPKGQLHSVGAPPSPIAVPAFSLIGGQRSVSGSPLASPNTIAQMLDFCVRHEIEPVTEHYAMKDVNEALDHLRAGKARYRLVLENA